MLMLCCPHTKQDSEEKSRCGTIISLFPSDKKIFYFTKNKAKRENKQDCEVIVSSWAISSNAVVSFPKTLLLSLLASDNRSSENAQTPRGKALPVTVQNSFLKL